MDAVGVKTLLQTVLDFDKCDIQVLLAAMTSVWRGWGKGGRVGWGEYDVMSEWVKSRDSGWYKTIKVGRRYM